MKRKVNHEATSHSYFTRSKRSKIASEILDLPTDVMILIFKLLTSSERRSAINVCQQWLDLVNEYFSKDHCLVLTSDLDYTTTGSLYRTFSDRLATTKDKRTFSHMVIESFPNNAEKLPLIRNFIELIGDEVTSLKIEDMSYHPDSDVSGNLLNVNVYSKLTNLETLEVSCDLKLADLSSATSLKRINVLTTVCDMTRLKNCRKIKGLESLTMPAIMVSSKDLSDESLVSFLEPSTKTLMEQMISREPYERLTVEAPTFNFCGATKLSLDDIRGIHIMNGNKPVPPEIFSQFKNMKRLKICHFLFDRQLALMANRVPYSGITDFTLIGIFVQPLLHLDKLLQSFPDLEKLTIYSFRLKNEHFSLICQFMPKLKELVIGGSSSEISVNTVLDGRYSLKDLRFLEKLEIKAKYQSNSGQWPPLPNLKELSLNGNGFRSFTSDFYSQIANKCPKLTHVTIDYKRGRHAGFAKFLPLVSQLKLTHLRLPSVRDVLNMGAANTVLIANLIDYGQELKEVTIKDAIGFSLSEELDLFSNIGSLMKVTSITTADEDEDDDQNRVMKRKDVKNLKNYLSKNLSLYKNLRETVDYVVENVIPANELYEMNQSFQTNFVKDDYDAEELENLYIVTHDFLGLSHFSLCKLLNTSGR